MRNTHEKICAHLCISVENAFAMSRIEIKVPDIGDFDAVEVIEILVKPGDTVSAEDSLITLESEKASMDVPTEVDGVVKKITIQVGDKVAEGDVIAILEAPEAEKKAADAEPAPAAEPEAEADDSDEEETVDASEADAGAPSNGAEQEVRVPDIGDFDAVEIIEVHVAEGDEVSAEDPLLTLESEKASMDVPAPADGRITSLKVSVGDKVAEGDLIAMLAASGKAAAPAPKPAAEKQKAPARTEAAPSAPTAPAQEMGETVTTFEEGTVARDEQTHLHFVKRLEGVLGPYDPTRELTMKPSDTEGMRSIHGSPSVRKYARELGVPLEKVQGSGPKGRILHDDVRSFVKAVMAGGAAPAAEGGAAAGPVDVPADLFKKPKVDFSKYGEIEEKPLGRIRKFSAGNLARNWVIVPHVTQFDEADITELEEFRQESKARGEKEGAKLTMLSFLLKASAGALLEFPELNSSLGPAGDTLILKKYVHVGVAVDTPNGLVVPVIRDVDQKGLFDLARELQEISVKARDGKLKADEMKGGCFSISSLGGIGGTAFTPIVNAPEVAILGVSRGSMKPVWDGKQFNPRLMLPISLSYDHRVIDGAQAARITGYLCDMLSDIRRLLL